MKLLDLEPRWLSPDVFSFLCPHCRQVTLLCKRVPMRFSDQARLVNPHAFDNTRDEETNAVDSWPTEFVPMKWDTCWSISGDFASLTVTPSIDASASGHWHGFITNGEIR